ncbi:MAG: LytTR family transcriptional regulator [Bacteroidales bacterium]|nr:LytTR family transcriptional regulator [Bacteroidales bacterium]
MQDLNDEIPFYLREKGNIIRQVIFVSLFALVFINLYSPFNAATWFEVGLGRIEFFFYSSLFILSGMLIIVLSKMAFLILAGSVRISYWLYGLWNIMEIVLLAIAYTALDLILIGNNSEVFRRFLELLFVTLLVLAIPYSLSWLWLSLKDKRKRLDELSKNTSIEFKERKMITFRDETGKLRFSVKSKDILYIESTDNYVTVVTGEKGKNRKNMLRKTMKRVEKELEGTTIQRCHRSYMVNFENVKQVKLIRTNLYIYLDFPEEIRIPVSGSYAERVHEFINLMSIS